MSTFTHIRNSGILLLFFCSGLMAPPRVHALAGTLEYPSLSFPSGFPNSEEIMKVLSDKKFHFAGGSFINAVSKLRYEGNAVSLNEFLSRLAACKGVKLSVSFSDGKSELITDSEAKTPEQAEGWTLGHNAWGDPSAFHITVDTRRIPEKEVKVPKSSPPPP
ncbi:MAG: hypothetical protein EOO09_21885 [Chitinophagaceae bacterium]|nr:MAG: hypothetical protein EOO09_21885 [Chitinophagaceae bacterium]